MQHEKDYYQILGVSPTATTMEIRRAYRQLAIFNHPDRNSSPQATLRMQEINDAYGVLGNKHRRIKYDSEHGISSLDSQMTSAARSTAAGPNLQQIFAEDLTQHMGIFLPLAISKIVLGLSVGMLVSTLSLDLKLTMYAVSIIIVSSVSIGVISLLRSIRANEIEARCPQCSKVWAAVELSRRFSGRDQKKHYKCKYCRYEWQFIKTKRESIF